jgi:hypothetical protein
VIEATRSLLFFSAKTNSHVVLGQRTWFTNLSVVCKWAMPPPWKSLDWILDVRKDDLFIDTIDENEIIASQANCPASLLSAQEYVSFGTIRSGGFLQLRNFLQRVVSSSVDLNGDHTLVLLQQILYQVGPPLSAGTWNVASDAVGRSWNLDIIDTARGLQFCDFICDSIIGPTLAAIEMNWDRHTSMHCVILILSHCLKLRPDHKKTCQRLLRCRSVLSSWINVLRQKLASVLATNNEEHPRCRFE